MCVPCARCSWSNKLPLTHVSPLIGVSQTQHVAQEVLPRSASPLKQQPEPTNTLQCLFKAHPYSVAYDSTCLATPPLAQNAATNPACLYIPPHPHSHTHAYTFCVANALKRTCAPPPLLSAWPRAQNSTVKLFSGMALVPLLSARLLRNSRRPAVNVCVCLYGFVCAGLQLQQATEAQFQGSTPWAVNTASETAHPCAGCCRQL